MKILYISNPDYYEKHIDYCNDLVFHGLVSLFGDDVVDSSYIWYMSDCEQLRNISSNDELYGRGFSLAGTLYDRTNLDRSNIKEKIESHYFDLIVYGSIWRCQHYYDIVAEHYNENEIIFIDGEDHNDLFWFGLNLKGLYFKRELTHIFTDEHLTYFPISFSIPRCKFTFNPYNKVDKLAKYVPGDGNSYTYDNEKDYYEQYQHAYFGLTRKRGGWDCLRHYEIIANSCLPYFEDFENKPSMIMTNWPTDLQLESNFLYLNYVKTHKLDERRYFRLLHEFFDYASNNLTTENITKNILTKIW